MAFAPRVETVIPSEVAGRSASDQARDEGTLRFKSPDYLIFSSLLPASSNVSGFLQNANRTCCAPSLACL